MAKAKQAGVSTAAVSSTPGSPVPAAPAAAAPVPAAPAVGSPAVAAAAQLSPVPSGVVLEPYQIILRPLVTEKGVHRSTRNNQYAFEVNTLANKDSIKKAVEDMFNVKVLKVRTQNRKGKPRRHRFKLGYTRDWKKALVTLNAEDRIDFF